MNVKAVIAVILGLVFQLAQVMPAMAHKTSCVSDAVACACCEDQGACDCAKNSEVEQKPTPLSSETSGELKVPAAKGEDSQVSMGSPVEIQPARAALASAYVSSLCGFAGVRLSVAFCSFVI
jgi:hypothetical protein